MRPSDVVGLDDAYERFCFDEATMVFGTWVRKELDKASEGKSDKKRKQAEGKRTVVLKRILDPKTETAKTYATPVAGIR